MTRLCFLLGLCWQGLCCRDTQLLEQLLSSRSTPLAAHLSPLPELRSLIILFTFNFTKPSCSASIPSRARRIDYFIESAPYGFLFTSRKTVETNEWAKRTSEFLKFCNEWIKSVESTFYGVICLMYICGQFHVINLPNRILSSLYFTVWNIKKTEFYFEGLLHEIGLLHIIKFLIKLSFT